MVGHGVPVHTSLQELDQVAPGGNPKALAQDAALPPTSQARAEEGLQPRQYDQILLIWQYKIRYLGWKMLVALKQMVGSNRGVSYRA